MDSIDTLIRGAAIGLFVLLAILDWRVRPNSAFAWTGVLYTTGVVAYLLAGQDPVPPWSPLLRLAMALAATAAPLFFWAHACLLFNDGFRLRPLHAGWLALIETGIFARGFAKDLALNGAPAWPVFAIYGNGMRAVSLALVAHALWVTWRGREGDLVEARAATRKTFVLVSGAVITVVILSGILFGQTRLRPPGWRLLEAAVFFAFVLCFAAMLLRYPRDVISEAASAPAAPSLLPPTVPSATLAQVGDEDSEALTSLLRLMETDAIWRETGLTIGGLAEKVGVPEYRLRRLINRMLGFRNFTAFVNAYRLAAAVRQLADPALARTPILTIALGLGWGSIGPFNRAFLAQYGVTPSEYRRNELRDGLAESRNPSPISKLA